MIKLKIILVGPSQAGKSTIANFLSEAIDFTNSEYRPTPGVRILEFEANIKALQTEIELWDCSGDSKYESYWPVFLWNAHGVVLVYNPEDKDQLPELERFYNSFVSNSGIPKNNCLVIGHSKKTDLKNSPPELSGEMSKILYKNANVLEDSDGLRKLFEKYVSTVLSEATDFDQDDLNLITMPL